MLRFLGQNDDLADMGRFMQRPDDMRDHRLTAQRYQRLMRKAEMPGEDGRARPLPRENDAGPLRLQLASPKREK